MHAVRAMADRSCRRSVGGHGQPTFQRSVPPTGISRNVRSGKGQGAVIMDNPCLLPARREQKAGKQ